MTRGLLILTGLVLVAVGATFALQGLNVLKGSGMSGQATWAVIGPIVAVVGLALIAFAGRGGRQS